MQEGYGGQSSPLKGPSPGGKGHEKGRATAPTSVLASPQQPCPPQLPERPLLASNPLTRSQLSPLRQAWGKSVVKRNQLFEVMAFFQFMLF